MQIPSSLKTQAITLIHSSWETCVHKKNSTRLRWLRKFDNNGPIRALVSASTSVQLSDLAVSYPSAVPLDIIRNIVQLHITVQYVISIHLRLYAGYTCGVFRSLSSQIYMLKWDDAREVDTFAYAHRYAANAHHASGTMCPGDRNYRSMTICTVNLLEI